MCFKKIRINGNLHTRVEAEKIFEVMSKRIKELESQLMSCRENLQLEKQRNITLSADLAIATQALPKRDKRGRFISTK